MVTTTTLGYLFLWWVRFILLFLAIYTILETNFEFKKLLLYGYYNNEVYFPEV